MLFGEVVDHAGIGGELAAFLQAGGAAEGLEVRHREVQRGFFLVVADPPAEDHRQLVGGLQAGGKVDAVLVDQGVVVHQLALGDGLRRVVVPGVDVHLAAFEIVEVGIVVVVELGPVVAQHQFVLTAEQLERSLGHQVDASLLLPAAAVAAEQAHAVAGLAVGKAPTRRGQGVVALAVHLVDRQLQRPVVEQALLQRIEGVHGVLVAVAPARGRVERAGEIGLRAVAVEDREAAVGDTLRCVLLIIDAEGEQGAVGEIGLDDAVVDLLFLLVVIDVAVVRLIGADSAAAQLAAVVQRAGDIHFGAVQVPGTEAAADVALEALGGALAHQVDGAGRIARAGEQAAGAAQHFHAVVDGHVRQALRGGGGAGHQGGGDAVELEAFNRITARPDVEALAVVVLHGETGGLFEHGGEAVEALVFHALAGHHADRLRRLAQRQVQLGRGAGRADRVGVGAFAGHVGGQSGDGGGFHFQQRARRQDQGIAAIRLTADLQAAAAQQALQCFVRRVAALQARAALAGSQPGVHREQHTGLAGEAVQYLV
ncbi:hypothetical protein D9M71_299300 [compost metagenome]